MCLARRAATISSACDGGTTSSSTPCRTSIGVDSSSVKLIGLRARYVSFASGHGPIIVCSYLLSNLCVSPSANGTRSAIPKYEAPAANTSVKVSAQITT